jgi:hypothetical protein
LRHDSHCWLSAADRHSRRRPGSWRNP